jgi:D-xylose 1-dehydrogenase (NADP+, D-xylono-1,5-lactone-forming)
MTAAPVRLGLLSTARINRQVLLASRASERAQVIAVASRDADRAREFAARHDIARWHGGYDALLADPDVEAVYVSLPNSLHVEWSMRGLRAGKHVLCEKPLALTAADAEAAFDAAERAGLVLAEAFMYRHLPQIARAAELVDAGAIGDLAYVHASMSFPLRDQADPRLAVELGGGALADLGCYCVSAARLLAGEPIAAHAEAARAASGVDVRMAGTLRFPGDVLAHIDCALDQPRRDRLEIVGTEGSLELGDPWHGRQATFALRREFVVAEVPFSRADPYRLELDAFCDAVRGATQPRWARADAVGQARTIELLAQESRSGHRISAR